MNGHLFSYLIMFVSDPWVSTTSTSISTLPAGALMMTARRSTDQVDWRLEPSCKALRPAEAARAASSSGPVATEVETTTIVIATDTRTLFGLCQLVRQLKMASFHGKKLACILYCDIWLKCIKTHQNGRIKYHCVIFRYSEACSSTLATTYSSGSSGEQKVVTTDLHHTWWELFIIYYSIFSLWFIVIFLQGALMFLLYSITI